ncbi:hypothetical protein [Spiroplasma endosymbiont of Polydrusus pterygomalis]|uniref:hypothetical protein n=1 Tax=Spiroplasma endosymbiont of Polydrusus pterygomalis TaxID=3139327 RepID=UPI003CCA73C7
MKKLLSLLSVLTIGVSALPTTIACSSYEKEEKLNVINHLLANNLENLKRSKREKINYKKIIIDLNDIDDKSQIRSLLVLNNKIYFTTINGKMYEYEPQTEKNRFVVDMGCRTLVYWYHF